MSLQVVEAAVVPVADKVKGHVPMAFVVLKAHTSTQHDRLKRDIVDLVCA